MRIKLLGALCLLLFWPQGSCLAHNPRLTPESLDSIPLPEGRSAWLGPSELVCPPCVEQMFWSPDGRYILSIRRSSRESPADFRRDITRSGNDGWVEDAPISLTIWSRETGRIKDVWRAVSARAEVFDVVWLPASDRVLVDIIESGGAPSETGEQRDLSSLLMLDASAARATTILTDRRVSIEPSPTHPIALLLGSPDTAPLIVKADGRLTPVTGYEQLGGLPFSVNWWSPDGRTAYLEGSSIRQGGPSGERSPESVRKWYTIDLVKGSIVQVERPEMVPSIGQTPALTLYREDQSLPSGLVKHRSRPTWLKANGSEQSVRLLVSADAREAQISPRGDAVAYMSEDSAFMKPIVQLTKAETVALAANYDAAMRSALAMRTKQIGVALKMAADDYSGVLPSDGPDFKKTLLAYVRDSDILDGFVYTFGGGPESGIEKPAYTVLGYIPGKGGRAVVYADSHVEWKADAP
ncbi:MAG: hypothetical protein WCL39_12330 [Armatimonadota bacterium]